MFDLKDRVVVITGAAGGMGRALTAMCAEEGAKLALADLDAGGLAAVAQQAQDVEAEVVSQAGNITEEAQTAAFFGMIKDTFGRADVLINLPGISVASPVAEMTLDDYTRVIDANIKSAFLSSKHFIPLVDAERGGQIILASSMAARRANPNASVYCAAKAAVTMLAEGLALQLKAANVRVTGLRPGPTDTQGFWGDRPVPREKFMQTDDIATVVKFILTLPPHVVVHEIAFESFEFFKR